MRKAKSEDCELIWKWANDPVVRAVSFSSDYIPLDNHKLWFSERLSDPNHLFFISEDEAGVPLGQIRFQINEDEALISVSLGPEFRDGGLGPLIIKEATRKFISESGVRNIIAVIKPENKQSIKAFKKCGYTNLKAIVYKGFEAVQLTYNYNTMDEHRDGDQRK